MSDTRRCFTGPTVNGESAMRIHGLLQAVLVCGGNVGVVTIGIDIEFDSAIAAVVGVVMIVGKHGIGKDRWGGSEGWGRGGGSRASFGMIGGLRRCCKEKSLFHCIVLALMGDCIKIITLKKKTQV